MVLVVVTLVVRLTYPAGLYPDLRMADLSALFYFSNWWQIAASGNYFVATGAVSPLTHTWSLAVEEQFYLVWPLVVVAVLHLGRRFDRGVELLLGISLVGVVASATEMAWLYHPGANITRLYFGTDTHAQSILVGSVLACVLTLVQRRRGLAGMAPVASSRPARVALTGLGLAGLAGTLVLTATLSGTSPIAYRGGFLVSALSAAALITGSVCVAGGPIARVLSVRPMVWIGTVSYGAYLWHFPVFIELDTARTGLGGTGLLAVRVAATFVLAALSYYLVERPVMEGVFWRSLRAAAPAAAALAATVAVVVVGTVAPETAAAPVRTARHDPGRRAPGPRRRQRLHDRPRPVPPGGRLAGRHRRARAGARQRARLRRAGHQQGRARLRPRRRRRRVVGPGRHPGVVVPPLADAVGGEVARYRPEVVGLLAGRFEITDHLVDGKVVSIDQPAWNHHLEDEMDQVVGVLSAGGAKVVLVTMPYIDPPQSAPDGSVYPENRNSRVDEYNRILDRVAARHPGEVTVIDLNRILDPAGHFQSVVDGVTVRWADGIHVTRAGGQWAEQSVLPTVAQLGLEARASGLT